MNPVTPGSAAGAKRSSTRCAGTSAFDPYRTPVRGDARSDQAWADSFLIALRPRDSFRQPGFSHGFYPAIEMIRSTDREWVAEIGNA